MFTSAWPVIFETPGECLPTVSCLISINKRLHFISKHTKAQLPGCKIRTQLPQLQVRFVYTGHK